MIEEFNNTRDVLVRENLFYLKYNKSTKEIKSPLQFVISTFAEILQENSAVVLFTTKQEGIKFIEDNSLITVEEDINIYTE